MSIYAIVNNQQAIIYEGMTQDQVDAMHLARGVVAQIVDRSQYDVFVMANKPVEQLPPDLTQQKAILKDSNATPDARFNALIKILGF